ILVHRRCKLVTNLPGALAVAAVEQLTYLTLGIALGRLRDLDLRVRKRPFGRVTARALAEGDCLHERIPAETVCAVHRHAGHLAGRVQACKLGLTPHVGVDATHVVMGAGSYGNRLED